MSRRFTSSALLLDLDGVLVDTEPAALSALAAGLTEAGAAHNAESLALRFRGKNLDFCADELTSILGARLPVDFVASVRTAARSGQAPQAEPGAARLLSCGLPLRIVTNCTHEQAWATLSAAHLGDLLDQSQIVSVDQVAKPKPAPDLHLRAISSLDVPAAVCLAVDDSLLGLAAATAAGAHPVGYAPTEFRRAQLREAGYRTVEHLAVLLELDVESTTGRRNHVTT